jgi:hypothetical protein
MIKKILTHIFGTILLILFLPFRGSVEKRLERIKKQYVDNQKTVSDDDAYSVLKDLAWSEYANGNKEKAKKYSNELIRLNSIVERNWNYGNAIHHPHTILGLICFDEGNLNGAINHLVKSSKTPGSPQLDTFGPKLDLAQMLLEAGEDKAVIKFLKNCKKFWELDRGRVSKWVSEIENGEVPQMLCKKET